MRMVYLAVLIAAIATFAACGDNSAPTGALPETPEAPSEGTPITETAPAQSQPVTKTEAPAKAETEKLEEATVAEASLPEAIPAQAETEKPEVATPAQASVPEVTPDAESPVEDPLQLVLVRMPWTTGFGPNLLPTNTN